MTSPINATSSKQHPQTNRLLAPRKNAILAEGRVMRGKLELNDGDISLLVQPREARWPCRATLACGTLLAALKALSNRT